MFRVLQVTWNTTNGRLSDGKNREQTMLLSKKPMVNTCFPLEEANIASRWGSSDVKHAERVCKRLNVVKLCTLSSVTTPSASCNIDNFGFRAHIASVRRKTCKAAFDVIV